MEKLELDFYYGKEAEQFTFYRLPKALITDSRFNGLSNNAKLLYGLMLDRMSLSQKRGWFDEENRVFIKYSLNNIEEDLNVSHKTASVLLRELQAIGLIEMVQRSGMANIIYVKNFVSGSRAVSEPVEKLHSCSNGTGGKTEQVQKISQSGESAGAAASPVQILHGYKNSRGTREISAGEPVEILPPSNTIKKERKETDPIILSDQPVDAADEAETYMQLIRENIDYDVMMERRQWRDRELYDELYQIICDVVCVPRKTIRIAGEDYPYSLVKSKFLKLNSRHLQYVISCMEKNTTKIANIKAYLITALYNAPNTMSHYYTAEVNHDMYGVG